MKRTLCKGLKQPEHLLPTEFVKMDEKYWKKRFSSVKSPDSSQNIDDTSFFENHENSTFITLLLP
jgi:hypothetical protein